MSDQKHASGAANPGTTEDPARIALGTGPLPLERAGCDRQRTAGTAAAGATGATAAGATGIRAGRRRRLLRRAGVGTLLAALAFALYLLSVLTGDETNFGPGQLIGYLLGDRPEDVDFVIGTVRLPRATLGILAGMAYGAGGVVFQTMLRNQLASPDIIGINAGASAFGVVALLLWGQSQSTVALVALGGALATAAAIYVLSYRGGFAGTRLILVGIGISSVLGSTVAYTLSKASQWDMQTASRWLTGSLNSATWKTAFPVVIACAAILPVMFVLNRNLNVMRLSDDSASGLGVNVEATRLTMILCAVALVATATSACGPIAFVAFMSGPIAARVAGPGASPLLPSAMVGAILVLASDYCGQYLFGARYPVGVITGVLGAPYLVYLLIRSNRQGSSL